MKTVRPTWVLIILSPLVAVFVGGSLHAWAVPAVSALIYFPHFYALLCRGQHRRTAGHALLWALWSTCVVVGVTIRNPDWAAAVIANGPAYRAEMFRWLQTGVGAEGNWRQFLPQHAVQCVVFVIACAVSGGLLGLMMGSYLLHFMAFYVGNLLIAAQSHEASTARLVAVALVGYSPWAVARVVGFVLLAIGIAEGFFRKVMPLYVWYPRQWWPVKVGLTLVLLDVVLKFLLAGTWRQVITAVVGF